MKYLDFKKSYNVEDINGNFLVAESGENVFVPLEVFIKSVILQDDRWGKNVKLLNSLMDLREKIKVLSYPDSKEIKILELTDEEWAICVEIAENPQVSYNAKLASALLNHIKDLKEASDVKPE